MNVGAVRMFQSRHGEMLDFSADEFPARLSVWSGDELTLGAAASHYGYVGDGEGTELVYDDMRFSLKAGMYFCVPGAATLTGGTGFVASRLGFEGLFHVGGPVESIGRLRYIDGCSDTLLIGPPVLGDPCLNLLHIPPNTQQTAHTHPSLRLGMIASGSGVCRTPDGEIPLEPGVCFSIAAEGVHSFHTTEKSLRVIAWHPDSDCGPCHGDHPMINRTIIDGVPASVRER